MSVHENTLLLEEAADLIDYWSGTLHAQLMEEDLKHNDLDLLRKHVREARNAQFDIEYRPEDAYDER